MTKWNKAYMDVAERFAELSTARRLKVGAIIVKDNRIISIGYNGMPSGWDNNCEHEIAWPTGEVRFLETKEEVIHAEANAISKLASSNESGKDADIFITHAPCMNCAKLIYGSKIKNVYFKNIYRSEDGINFLKACNIGVEQV
jgi:dCMP deaminase